MDSIQKIKEYKINNLKIETEYNEDINMMEFKLIGSEGLIDEDLLNSKYALFVNPEKIKKTRQRA